MLPFNHTVVWHLLTDRTEKHKPAQALEVHMFKMPELGEQRRRDRFIIVVGVIQTAVAVVRAVFDGLVYFGAVHG